jgi:hypothetical protein
VTDSGLSVERVREGAAAIDEMGRIAKAKDYFSVAIPLE